MSDIPALINTDIINSSRDIFWEDAQCLRGIEPRPVLILSAEYTTGSPEEDQLNALVKAGCKLQEQQYNIIRLKADEQVAWFKIREQLAPKVILLFNVMPAQLGISSLFHLNGLNRFDGCYWVPTLSLTHLIQDKALKGQLWNGALKPIFETKVYGEIV